MSTLFILCRRVTGTLVGCLHLFTTHCFLNGDPRFVAWAELWVACLLIRNGSVSTKRERFGSCMGEGPISVQIRAVANLCKYKYKNVFFKDRQ